MSPQKIILCEGKFLALVKEGRWEYVDRIGSTGAASIVAVTDEQKLLLVEQHRIPVHARTIELPAGIVGDEPGGTSETLAEAAKRELLEGSHAKAALAQALSNFRGFYEADPYWAVELDHFQLLLAGDLAVLPETEIDSSGYVVHTLTASLWCLVTTIPEFA